jgi:hypothetical protein
MMCIGGGRSYQTTVEKTTLPAPAPMVAPQMMQSTPAPATPRDEITYKKKGKRGLTIPRTTSVNVPGA